MCIYFNCRTETIPQSNNVIVVFVIFRNLLSLKTIAFSFLEKMSRHLQCMDITSIQLISNLSKVHDNTTNQLHASLV